MAPPNDNSEAASALRPLRILVVDDHPLTRAGVRALLDSQADLYIAAEAADGLVAARLVQDVACDVVLMDLSLPGLRGAELTRQLLSSAPDVHVLAFSAHEDISLVRALLDAGASGYALKRSACDELALALRVVGRGGTYLDPSLAAQLVGGGARRTGAAESLRVVRLSQREAEVVRLIANGYTAKEAAARLGLGPRTIETYKARAMSKLDLRSRADLVRYALRSGWLRDNLAVQ